jgi:cytochrome b6-f complex iron-sulfur subunit
MATIADLSGEEREQRAAELKRKMQEAAQRAKAAQQETQPADGSSAPAEAAPPQPVTVSAPVGEEPGDGEPTAEIVADSTPVVAVAEAPVTRNGNGAAAPPISAPPVVTSPIAARFAAAAQPAAKREAAEATAPSLRGINRREFLTYTWAAALGLLTLEAGVASFDFLYPRFRAGEFGGQFFVPISDVPPADQAPNGKYTAGKFWLVTTAEGTPKALYMVCVHLGCLYKWVDSNFRFECPCHGSKYTHDGYYIEGPAARSLDYFDVVEANGELVVDTGNKNIGAPASESPFRALKV